MTAGEVPTEHRRQGDVVLERVRGELALLHQATELSGKATDARLEGLTRAIDNLDAKMDALKESQAEPAATPAGRAMLEKIAAAEKAIADHDLRLDANDDFQAEIRGAFKTIRAQLQVGGFLLGVVSGITAVITILRAVSGQP